MPVLQYLPRWTVNYSYDTDPAILRSPNLGGFVRQSKVRDNRVVIANAERRLRGSEILYFEWFIRGVCNDGAIKFDDYYADHNGLQFGTVRVLNGSYQVSTDKLNHTVTCQLEIFR